MIDRRTGSGAGGGDRGAGRAGAGNAPAIVSPAPGSDGGHVGGQHRRAARGRAVVIVVSPDGARPSRTDHPDSGGAPADLCGATSDDAVANPIPWRHDRLISAPAARGAAEHAELGAVRMVE